MSTPKIAETKQVWVAWGSRDPMGGYMSCLDFIVCVAETRAAARRKYLETYGARHGFKDVADSAIEQSTAVRLEGENEFLVPGRIERETDTERDARMAQEKAQRVREKALILGLSDEEIDALQKGVAL